MARVDNLSNFLTDVADAIRDKKGTSAAIAASSFDTEIAGIVTSDDVKLQEKTVNSSTSKQTVTPDSGYDALSKVTVNAIATATQATPSITVNDAGLITASSTQSAGYVAAGTKSATKQLTTKAAETITPGTSNKTAVAKGVYTTGAVTIKGDSNLVASNIRSGKSIFGVSGTLVEGITPSGSKTITTNGTHDVTNYASAVVNVPSEDISAELTSQTDLLTTQETTIDSILTALEGKASGGNEPVNILTNDYSQIGYSGTYIKSNGYTTSNVLWSDLTPYTGQSATWYVTNPIEIEPNTYYKYEGFTSGNNPGACFLGEDETTIYEGFVYKYEGVFKTPEEAKYIVMTVAAESIETKSVKKLTEAEIKELEIDALIERTLSGDYVNNRVTTIGTEALRATQITGLHCENVTSVGGESVRQCNYLVNVYLPKCTNLGGYSFGICPLLEKVELGAMTNIRAYDFYSCSKLTTLIINNTTSVCALANVNAFNSTPIASGTGYIYVPDTLVDSYKTATNWSTYANQIKGISTLS